MKRIFIVGYMGVGKTTVGKALATSLNLSFIDLDFWLQNTYRKTVADLFKEKGETSFREIERKALLEVASFEDVVISTGGGTPCFFDNMDVMNAVGTTIYLKADMDEIAARLSASKNIRPLLVEKKSEELVSFISTHLAERDGFYQKAQIVFHTDRLVTRKHIHVTVEGITEMLKNKEK